MKSIGIIIGNTKPFSSGLPQNAYFLYHVFQSSGHSCKFLTYSESYLFDYEKIPVKQIKSVYDFYEFNVIISVFNGVSKDVYTACKKKGIKIIGFVCGNVLCLDNETFLKTEGDIICSETPVDVFWVIESFAYMASYVETKRKAPVTIIPHLWSPVFIEAFMTAAKKDKTDLIYKIAKHTEKKIDIVILEPNINFVKTALVPLVAAERIYQENADLINEVYIFNFPEHSKSAANLMNRLDVGKKVRKFKGIAIPEILLYFNDRSSIPIFVSHQFYTQLNYLYYELLYYGYPLIHNSIMMKDYGYFYEDCAVDLCAKQIINAFENHNSVAVSQIDINRKMLERINPYNESCVKMWNSFLMKL
jgi:hypothetical protein